MSEQYSYADNAFRLKKCKKTYSILFIFFIAANVLLIIYAFSNLLCIGIDANLLGPNIPSQIMGPNFLLLLGDAAIIVPLTAFFGFRITCRQHDLSAFFAICLYLGNLILFFVKRDWVFFDRVPVAFWTFMIYNCGGLIASVIGMKTNREFHRLEGEPGYPHFNERLEEQNVKIDRFQCEYNKLKRTATDQMLDLPPLQDKRDE